LAATCFGIVNGANLFSAAQTEPGRSRRVVPRVWAAHSLSKESHMGIEQFFAKIVEFFQTFVNDHSLSFLQNLLGGIFSNG
jgi:hypothetical protein